MMVSLRFPLHFGSSQRFPGARSKVKGQAPPPLQPDLRLTSPVVVHPLSRADPVVPQVVPATPSAQLNVAVAMELKETWGGGTQ